VVLRLPIKRVQCNVCGWEGYRFKAIAGASYIRCNAFCPRCGSGERQRALITYLNKKGSFNRAGKRYLDMGPVRGFRAYFQARGGDYVSMDLDSPLAMVKTDATRMGFPDDTFDFIISSHVLEHIKDDSRAIKEMRRVLRDDGTCYIMVPLSKSRRNTVEYEKPNPLDPGHVRSYGMDVVERIKSAGFRVEQVDLVAEASQDEARLYGLGLEEICFQCTKGGAQ